MANNDYNIRIDRRFKNSERFEFWVNKSHNIINSQYKNAIDNYKVQKNNFINLLGIESENAEQEFLQQINDEIIEGNDEDQVENEKMFDSIFSIIDEDFEEYIMGSPQQLQNLIDKIKQYQKAKNNEVSAESLYLKFKQEIDEYITGDELIENTRLALLERVGIQKQFQSNIDIQQNIMGYLRKKVFNKLLQQNKKVSLSKNNYIISLKGYIREELITAALIRVLEQYKMTAKQAGSLAINGQQIKYDIILGVSSITNLSDNELLDLVINKDFPKIINGQASMEDSTIFGAIQSKSWALPKKVLNDEKLWDRIGKNQKYNYSKLYMGNKAELLSDLSEEDRYFWHAGLYQAMSNIEQIIGPMNFLYATGNQIYWTYDLLTRFKEAQYVLAFDKPNKVLTSMVRAVEHDDGKK